VSGILAVLHRDGAPVDGGRLARLTALLGTTAPGAPQCWHRGPVGLAHVPSAVAEASPPKSQPVGLEERWWLTGDVRVDDRAHLTARLEGDLHAASDAELVLHAYRRWGERCVDHLLGDYAFVIWDARARCLFAARDPFGVKQLLYASAGPTLLISNSFACLRHHPGIPSQLDEQAIGDFLVSGIAGDPTATVFASIARLPPGHTLRCSPGSAPRVERYFSLPALAAATTPLQYADPMEYVAHFRTLLEAAISDRLRASHVTVSMSGGLDSTMIAAVGARIRQPDPAR
jgi:asparagine synthase (glutamine-hydrolysing)